MTRRFTATIFVPVLVLGLAAAGCSKKEESPTAPSAVLNDSNESFDVTGPGVETRTPISLKGVVRGLNTRTGQFTLVVQSDGARPETRLIRTNDQTEVWAGGRRVRRRAIENGLGAEVQGADAGEFVLARKITLLRRAAR